MGKCAIPRTISLLAAALYNMIKQIFAANMVACPITMVAQVAEVIIRTAAFPASA